MFPIINRDTALFAQKCACSSVRRAQEEPSIGAAEIESFRSTFAGHWRARREALGLHDLPEDPFVPLEECGCGHPRGRHDDPFSVDGYGCRDCMCQAFHHLEESEETWAS